MPLAKLPADNQRGRTHRQTVLRATAMPSPWEPQTLLGNELWPTDPKHKQIEKEPIISLGSPSFPPACTIMWILGSRLPGGGGGPGTHMQPGINNIPSAATTVSSGDQKDPISLRAHCFAQN